MGKHQQLEDLQPPAPQRQGGESPHLFLHLSSVRWGPSRRQEGVCIFGDLSIHSSQGQLTSQGWARNRVSHFRDRSCWEQIFTFPSTPGRCRKWQWPKPNQPALEPEPWARGGGMLPGHCTRNSWDTGGNQAVLIIKYLHVFLLLGSLKNLWVHF